MSNLKIVVLQRGWVIVGNLSKDGEQCFVDNGAVVRYWGTSKGLGQLAVEGPLKDTKLDPIPRTSFHELTTVMVIDCEEKAWKGKW